MLAVLLSMLPSLASGLWSDVLGLWAHARSAVGSPLDLPLGAALAAISAGLSSAAERLGVSLVLLAAAGLAALGLQRGLPRSLGASQARRSSVSVAADGRAGFAFESFQSAAFAHAKWIVVTALVLWPLMAAAPGLLDAHRRDGEELLLLVADLGSALGLRAMLVLSLVGLVDRGVQAWLLRRRLRMTRRELIEERRTTDGDPLLAAERRRRALEQRASVDSRELSELALLVTDGDGRVLGLRAVDGRGHSPLATPPAQQSAAFVVWIKADGELARRLHDAGAGLRRVPDPQLIAAAWPLELSEPLPRALEARVRAHLDGMPVR
jgi:flagellar biosynthesis protein FlhB